jgi:hypothetical protein
MTIAAIRGSWPANLHVPATTLTKFDSNLATLVTDKTGDTMFGAYTTADGIPVYGSILANAPGAVITTSGNAVFKHGGSDDVVLNPPRSRTIVLSTLECFSESNGGSPPYANIVLCDTLPGVANVHGASGQAFWMPLTRVHFGAKLVSATLYFFPQNPSPGTSLSPSVLPTLQLFRINPSTDVALTSLAASGPAVFPAPSSAAAYVTTAPKGSAGSFVLTTLNGGTASILAGDQLTDGGVNFFQVTTSGLYADGALVPISAIVPAAPEVFYGAGTNHSPGDSIAWVIAPTNCAIDQTVGPEGLTGGLNAGYAQSLTFNVDTGLGIIDSDYCYIAKFTDDNATTGGVLYAGPWAPTVYTALVLSFANILTLVAQ